MIAWLTAAQAAGRTVSGPRAQRRTVVWQEARWPGSFTCRRSLRNDVESERTFWPAFLAPTIRGSWAAACFDAIVGGLRELPSVDGKSCRRMADFLAEVGRSDRSWPGVGADTFLSTAKDNRKEATHTLLEDSPVASVMLTLGRRGVNWSGKPQELYQGIEKSWVPGLDLEVAGKRSACLPANCAASHPNFAYMDFPSALRAKAAIVSSP